MALSAPEITRCDSSCGKSVRENSAESICETIHDVSRLPGLPDMLRAGGALLHLCHTAGLYFPTMMTTYCDHFNNVPRWRIRRLGSKREAPQRGLRGNMRAEIMRLLARLMFRAVFGFGMLLLLAGLAVLLAGGASAATYAAVVMDARNGKILHSENADLRLHPASLTKMMTVYVAIQAVENGEINLDTKVRISKFAASEPPSKIHLKPGSRVKLRYLIRAAAVRSANDAATAIAEAVSGSENAFAARMNRTARAMGLTKTTFKNAHGLTQAGHLSSARDMAVLGRHVVYNYPEYYHLFSKRTADVGHAQVRNTNRRFLGNYSGADGIKTGYTSKAGFNLTASAKRGNERIIVTVFGGRSGKTRDAHVAKLMDKGFNLASDSTRLRRPSMPDIAFGEVSRVDTTVESASKRLLRPAPAVQPASAAAGIAGIAEPLSQGDADPEVSLNGVNDLYPAAAFARPLRRQDNAEAGGADPVNGIMLGKFATSVEADKQLMKVAVMDFRSLALARKDIRKESGGYVAKFTGMTSESARKACARLTARGVECLLTRGGGVAAE